MTRHACGKCLQCDECRSVLTFEKGLSLLQMRELSWKKGWHIRSKDGKIIDMCPGCNKRFRQSIRRGRHAT